MELLSKDDETFIINTLTNASTIDIDSLTSMAYKFIHLSSGFIAHYSLMSFKDHYQIAGNLGDEILANQKRNQWNNFNPGDNDYEYMMQKKKIYNIVCENIKEYRRTLSHMDTDKWTLTIEGIGKDRLSKLINLIKTINEDDAITINGYFQRRSISNHDFMMNVLNNSIEHLKIHDTEKQDSGSIHGTGENTTSSD